MARLRTLVGLFGTLAAIIVALALLDWSALARGITQLSAGAVAAAALLSVVTSLLLALRWSVLAAQRRAVCDGREFRSGLVSQAFNLITPASAGSDLYRVVVAGDREGGHGRAASLVTIERMLGMSAYAIAFVACYLVTRSDGNLASVFAAALPAFAVVATLPLVVILVSRVLATHSHRWLGAPDVIRAMLAGAAGLMPGRALAVVALSLLATFSWLACVVVLAAAVGVGLGIGTIGMIAVIAEFSRLLPISVQGVGVREATFAFFAAQAGGVLEAAFVACGTAYALHFALVAVVAFVARYGELAIPRFASGVRRAADQLLRSVR